MRGLNLVYKTQTELKNQTNLYTGQLPGWENQKYWVGWQIGNIVAGRLSDGIVQLSFRSDQVTDRVGKQAKPVIRLPADG